ncbi:Sideroflexin-1-like [Oopsacas minuta]|uniref:Sidoreflexin n=1 Tax=Oopsacas minuta TaxID=111878 RepID=A0AAV7K1Y9_9METZ|nr:Sideroflexin-1-like [Oopsacas minuta]
MTETKLINRRIDLDKPRYIQDTYMGRAKHFFLTTNPLNIFASNSRLEAAATLVKQYREGREPTYTSKDQVYAAKALYESAFHPGTGEKMFILGRMSAQVPCNMFITGFMLTFYKSPAAVILWQWVNQTFNAIVNYTNRSATTVPTVKQMMVPYVSATFGALFTALTLNHVAKYAPPLIGRFVPFSAVAAANCINVPLMRQDELINGIQVTDENDVPIGKSKKAAVKAIFQVVVSRIGMAAPGMIIPPLFMNWAEQNGIWKRYPWAPAPIQIIFTGIILTLATPMCCALFPQKSSMAISKLEPEAREQILRINPSITHVYFNKGL